MKKWLLGFYLLCANMVQAQVVIAVHGGAGTMDRSSYSVDDIRNYEAALDSALTTGYEILLNGGAAIDAVEKAIMILEDSPLFNAGRGSVLNEKGMVEMDASIMDGNNLKAGAVAGVKYIKNPITAAKSVMLHSPHVMMSGEGAEEFAREEKIEMKDSAYFIVQKQYDNWLKSGSSRDKPDKPKSPAGKHGTVGAVALDQKGILAAGTSTGGMMMKKYGRIGDSPVIGAGTYAGKTGAVSCTGHGEYFIRLAVAHEVCMRMELLNESLKESADAVIKKVSETGGSGGLIALDAKGNIAMPFNTSGMFRGFIDATGQKKILIFKD